MRKGLLLTALLAGSLLSANAEDYLKAYVKPGGENAQLSIRLVNADADYTAFSFKVNLPEGLSFKTGAEPVLSTSRADASHQVKFSEVTEDGAKTMTVAVFSYKEEGTTKTGNKNFSAKEGEILTIPVVADNAFFTNAFTVGTDDDNLLAEVEFVTKETTSFVGKALSVTQRAKMGDANGDNAVDTNDAIMVTKHYLKKELLTADQIERASFSSNGNVDTNDAVDITKTYLKKF